MSPWSGLALDASGYRRYTAEDAVELIRIRTLAEAGVPLARIRELTTEPDDAFQVALTQIDDDLTARIKDLRQTQRRLRELAAGHTRLLPAEVDQHLKHLGKLGFSQRWVAMESDLWILVFATHPDAALELFCDQAEALTDPVLRRMYLDYDQAYGLDPDDPVLAEFAGRIVQATVRRYGSGDLPGPATGSDIPQLIQDAVNASSPAWQRLDALIRAELCSSSESAEGTARDLSPGR